SSRCLRPPPTPPLFPYTTLFRSAGSNGLGPHPPSLRREHHLPLRHIVITHHRLPILDLALEDQPRQWVLHLALDGALQRPGAVADRKSTRLNSSHRTISYAVFCL